MSPVAWVVLAVAAQRLAELWLAGRNTRRLKAQGAVEAGAGHYPLFPLLHGSWLLAILLMVPADRPVSPPLLAVFLALQAARIWVIASLGQFWTTRILTLPGASLVRRGPYRWLRHPNYWIVTAEIAVLPMAFGAHLVALAWSAMNAGLLWHRIRVEEAVLAPRRNEIGTAAPAPARR